MKKRRNNRLYKVLKVDGFEGLKEKKKFHHSQIINEIAKFLRGCYYIYIKKKQKKNVGAPDSLPGHQHLHSYLIDN